MQCSSQPSIYCTHHESRQEYKMIFPFWETGYLVFRIFTGYGFISLILKSFITETSSHRQSMFSLPPSPLAGSKNLDQLWMPENQIWKHCASPFPYLEAWPALHGPHYRWVLKHIPPPQRPFLPRPSVQGWLDLDQGGWGVGGTRRWRRWSRRLIPTEDQDVRGVSFIWSHFKILM